MVYKSKPTFRFCTGGQKWRNSSRTRSAPSNYEGADKEKKSKWREIGAAFTQRDGEGFDLLLEAFPASGKVVLRKPKEDDKAE
jgi:hypothetical protein